MSLFRDVGVFDLCSGQEKLNPTQEENGNINFLDLNINRKPPHLEIDICVVPPEDGCLTPETCRGLRHNKVIVKVKVC
jgi:hypothetical protein